MIKIIEGELCRAGTLLRYYADLASDTNAAAARAKEDRDSTQALVSFNIRADREAAKEKCTVDILKEIVLTNKTYIDAQHAYLLAEADAKKADLYFRSMKQKTDCLMALSYHQRSVIKVDGGQYI